MSNNYCIKYPIKALANTSIPNTNNHKLSSKLQTHCSSCLYLNKDREFNGFYTYEDKKRVVTRVTGYECLKLKISLNSLSKKESTRIIAKCKLKGLFKSFDHLFR